MEFTIARSIAILERTPAVLHTLLYGLEEDWLLANEGAETFSPFDVLGHLIHGEKTDWVLRAKSILASDVPVAFEPWDRFAQYELSKGKSTTQLLDEFASLRKENITWLRSATITKDDLQKTGIHPVLKEVSLKNLLATWVVHDLTHIAQVTRVMAKQYKTEIGPWTDFFRVLNF